MNWGNPSSGMRSRYRSSAEAPGGTGTERITGIAGSASVVTVNPGPTAAAPGGRSGAAPAATVISAPSGKVSERTSMPIPRSVSNVPPAASTVIVEAVSADEVVEAEGEDEGDDPEHAPATRSTL